MAAAIALAPLEPEVAPAPSRGAFCHKSIFADYPQGDPGPLAPSPWTPNYTKAKPWAAGWFTSRGTPLGLGGRLWLGEALTLIVHQPQI